MLRLLSTVWTSRAGVVTLLLFRDTTETITQHANSVHLHLTSPADWTAEAIFSTTSLRRAPAPYITQKSVRYEGNIRWWLSWRFMLSLQMSYYSTQANKSAIATYIVYELLWSDSFSNWTVKLIISPNLWCTSPPTQKVMIRI